MADYLRRVRTIRHVEFVLDSPANHAEVGKAVAAATAEIREHRSKTAAGVVYDDDIVIEARDDQVVVCYEVETEGERDG